MSTPADSTGRSIALKIALTVGFLALAWSVLTAHVHPPEGYELSLYSATPIEFWAGIGIAMAIAMTVAFVTSSARLRVTALGLAAGAGLSTVGLPVLRDYYFYGTGDPLTHLGWAKDFASGALGPTELLYPGIHLSANVFASFVGLSLTRSLLFIVLVLAAVFVVFLPLTVRAISRRPVAVVVATFSALMFFPINNIAVHMHAHPFTQTLLFSPLVLFLAFAYLRQPTATDSLDVTAIGVLLASAGAAAVLLHPQQAANLIVVFVGICVAQFAYRRYRSGDLIARHRTLYAQTAFLTVVFAVWSVGDVRFANNLDHLRRALVSYLLGAPPPAGERVGSQVASLTAIGASLPEMFVKLFFVSLVYTLLAGVLMAAVWLGRADETDPTEVAFVKYLTLGAVGAGFVTALYLAGSVAEHYFRHGAFLMLIVAIVGSLAIARFVSPGGPANRPRGRTVAVAIALAVLLPLSVITIYPSPYIHQQSQHVTEERLSGYETAFEITDERLPLAGIREGPYRYSDAVHGVEASTPYDVYVTEDELGDLRRSYGAGYVIISDYDRQREIRAYEELRYSRETFQAVGAQPGVNLVESNGVVQLYHVPRSDE